MVPQKQVYELLQENSSVVSDAAERLGLESELTIILKGGWKIGTKALCE
jgi:hypothetical protein